jgi:hypothetical protein
MPTTGGGNGPQPALSAIRLIGAVISPSSSAFVTCLKDCLVRRTVTTLRGGGPARDCGSVGVRRGEPVPGLRLVTGWPLLKRPHVAVGVTEI